MPLCANDLISELICTKGKTTGWRNWCSIGTRAMGAVLKYIFFSVFSKVDTKSRCGPQREPYGISLQVEVPGGSNRWCYCHLVTGLLTIWLWTKCYGLFGPLGNSGYPMGAKAPCSSLIRNLEMPKSFFVDHGKVTGVDQHMCQRLFLEDSADLPSGMILLSSK